LLGLDRLAAEKRASGTAPRVVSSAAQAIIELDDSRTETTSGAPSLFAIFAIA